MRPSGAGGDSLLLNFGQTGRRSRTWWRSTLDQYSAADVLVPAVRLEHQFPGGPIDATFTARYGPDSAVLESFTATAEDPRALAATLEEGVERLDQIYEQALAEGKLRPDPTLRESLTGAVDPALQRLIDAGLALRAREEAAALGVTPGLPVGAVETPGGVNTPEVPAPQTGPATARFVVQFATPDAQAFDAALTGVRGTPGVRSLSVTSTAMGGSSVMSVTYAGSALELAGAHEFGAGSVAELNALGQIGRFNFGVDALVAFGDFQSEFVNDQIDRRFGFNFNTSLRLGGTTIPVQAALRRGRRRNGTKVNNILSTASVQAGRMAFSLQVDHQSELRAGPLGGGV